MEAQVALKTPSSWAQGAPPPLVPAMPSNPMAIAEPQEMTELTSSVSREVKHQGQCVARLCLRSRGLPFVLGVLP